MTFQQLAQMQQPAPVNEPQGPAERILLLADQLPESRLQLEQEAARLEKLLTSMEEPETSTGSALMAHLEAVITAQLEGIFGLLEFDHSEDEQLLAESLDLIVSSHRWLEELEAEVDSAREEMPLVA